MSLTSSSTPLKKIASEVQSLDQSGTEHVIRQFEDIDLPHANSLAAYRAIRAMMDRAERLGVARVTTELCARGVQHDEGMP